MNARLIDLLCERHRNQILSNRVWPSDCKISGTFASYLDCRECGNQPAQSHSHDLAEQSAFHEAGHAVMYLLAEDATVAHAHIDPTRNETGHVRFSGRLNADELLAGALGGVAASMRWLERMRLLDDAALVDMAAAGYWDYEFAREHVSGIDAADFTRVAGLVERRWPSIERVADALLAAGRLSGDEIAAIARIEASA